MVVGKGIAETSVSFPGWPRIGAAMPRADHMMNKEDSRDVGTQGCRVCSSTSEDRRWGGVLRFSLAGRHMQTVVSHMDLIKGRKSSLETVDPFLSVAQQIPPNSGWVVGLSFQLWFKCLCPPKEIPRWCNGKEFSCQCRRHKRHRFDPWVGKIPWNRK